MKIEGTVVRSCGQPIMVAVKFPTDGQETIMMMAVLPCRVRVSDGPVAHHFMVGILFPV